MDKIENLEKNRNELIAMMNKSIEYINRTSALVKGLFDSAILFLMSGGILSLTTKASIPVLPFMLVAMVLLIIAAVNSVRVYIVKREFAKGINILGGMVITALMNEAMKKEEYEDEKPEPPTQDSATHD